MLLDYALDGGQTNSGTFELILAEQTVEHTKELVRVFHAETNSVVANRNYSPTDSFHLAHLNDGALSWTSVLNGIVQQLYENLFHQSGIAIDSGQGGDLPLDLAARELGCQFTQNEFHKRVKWRLLPVQL